MITTIKTSLVAAHVILNQYGYEFDLDKSIHKKFIKTILLPNKVSSKLKERPGRVVFNSLTNLKISEKAGIHLHESVMEDLAIYISAQTEIGISIASSIQNWMDKYEIDDGILQLDTAKKHFYRFRKKEDKRKAFVALSKKMNKSLFSCSNQGVESVPFVFEHNTKHFVGMLKAFNTIIKSSCDVLEIEISDVLEKDKSKHLVYSKKVLSVMLHWGCEMTERDIATYFNISNSTANYYIKYVNENLDKFIKDIYMIYKRVIIDFNDERKIVLESLESSVLV